MVHLILMNVKLVGIMSARCKAETSGIKLKQKRAPPWTDLGQGWGTGQGQHLGLGEGGGALVHLLAGIGRGPEAVANVKISVQIHAVTLRSFRWGAPVLPPESVIGVGELVTIWI